MSSPFAVSDSLSYGFAAANIQGGSEASWCCQCYNLTFTSGPVAGKSLILQVTNTGGNLGNGEEWVPPGRVVPPNMVPLPRDGEHKMGEFQGSPNLKIPTSTLNEYHQSISVLLSSDCVTSGL
ncbi:glycoside hydrolase family 45 protein [Ceratobasidium sp. AG-Ba]|nr:glycoside hydrolase family 45 protein [Ceratobasidium sp. AG-Ba]QRV99295.1 glycoside hydrolase family 45 protein [Ceratobasidium sp. AG-Ba]QRW13795.1 glycoside hydrolase family 45 protein [Ceratobasidium sp. AG-Ba]